MRTIALVAVLALSACATTSKAGGGAGVGGSGPYGVTQEMLGASNRYLTRVDMLGGASFGAKGVLSSANYITNSLSASAIIDFASTTVGKVDSSGITVTGAKVGDPCYVGVPAAAGALKADYSCYVSTADTAKVVFSPMDVSMATLTLSSASPSTATAAVSAGSICTCTPQGGSAAIAAGGCAASVSSTTLTVTGPNTVTTPVVYSCSAPVDPPSGTYFVRVTSSQ